VAARTLEPWLVSLADSHYVMPEGRRFKSSLRYLRLLQPADMRVHPRDNLGVACTGDVAYVVFWSAPRGHTNPGNDLRCHECPTWVQAREVLFANRNQGPARLCH
jgi:hypothetical protein